MAGKQTQATRTVAPKTNATHARPIAAPLRIVTPLQLAGNQAVGHLLASRTIQAKLVITPPNDRHESEADRAADTVLRMPADAPPIAPSLSRVSRTPVQRKCPDCEKETLQRKCAKCEEEEMQRKASKGAAPGPVAPSVETSISAARGGGHTLPRSVRSHFEARFGADLSGVRLHTDTAAARLADTVGAHAFTTGKDIFFGAGRYQPDSLESRRLLAHEVAHTIQQEGFDSPVVQRAEKKAEPPAAKTVCSMQEGEKIYPAAKLGIQWLDRAIQRVKDFIAAPADRANKATQGALKRHFHSVDPAVARRVLERLQVTRHDIDQLRPGAPMNVECHDDADRKCETAPAYAWKGDIFFCPKFFGETQEEQAEAIVHEMLHALKAHIVDRAYSSDRALRYLSTPEALANADSFALLVQDLGTGRAPETQSTEDSYARNCRDLERHIRPAMARAQRWNRTGETRIFDAPTEMIRTHLGKDTKDVREAAYKFYHESQAQMYQSFEFLCDKDCGGRLATGKKAVDRIAAGLGIGAAAGLVTGLLVGALAGGLLGAVVGGLLGAAGGALAGIIAGAASSHDARIHVCPGWKDQDESARIESILAAAYEALGRSQADGIKYAKLAGALSAHFYRVPTMGDVDKSWIEAQLTRVRDRLAKLRAQYERSSDDFASSLAAERERESTKQATATIKSQARSDAGDRLLWGGSFSGNRIRSAVTAAVSGKTVTLTARMQITYKSLSDKEGQRRAAEDIPRIDAAIRDVWQVTFEGGEYAGYTLRLMPSITYLPKGATRDDKAFLIEVRGPDKDPSSGEAPSGIISLALAHLQGNRVIVVAHELAHLFGFTDTYFTVTTKDRKNKGKTQETLVVGRSDPKNRPDLLGDIDPVGLERAHKKGQVTADDVKRQTQPVHVWEEEASIVLRTLGVAPPVPDKPTPDSEDFDPQTELDRERGEKESELARIRAKRQRIDDTMESLKLAEEIIALEKEERDLSAKLKALP